VGVNTIKAWARTLPRGAVILDIGCGPGSPREAVLVEAGFAVHAIDASPSLLREFSNRFPNAKVLCEAVEESSFFGKTFDAVFAWGLIFLLPPETQCAVIHSVSNVLKSGGRFLFTAPTQTDTWNDLSTGRTSFSLGEQAYRSIMASARLTLVNEYVDEGENHYYDATKQYL
ncbi:MAG TPA: class I SAM-dependent methyltransferase, partial [Pyrinomonadaceae bacterium]|nr:class I SAM-dependent methyltransferase [Pyrinomonadaceae bacterium]